MASHWYKHAIIYGIDVKTFQDSNGDGIGDFQGLISRLDYLVELGITCLWLLPFYASPNRDNGYDVSDFYSIHPSLGTLDDFQLFLKEAHARDLRVVVDLVVHHTSTEHPWFKAARSSPTSIYRDYYIWSGKNPQNHHPGNAFPGPETDTWCYDEVASAWYFHQFYHFQPDLNIANVQVQEEIFRIVEFWCALGVDGFRVDAAGLMFSYKGLPNTVTKMPGRFLKKLNLLIRKQNKQAVLLGEADTQPSEMALYFWEGERIQMLLNFLLNQSLFAGLATETAEPIISMMSRIPVLPQKAQWVNFIRNLDELNIDKLPKEEQARIYEVFGKDPSSHIYNRGLRRRAAPMMNNEKRLKLLFSLLFALPGTPLICYGDEIGMGEDLSLEERSSVRTPMQWSSEKNAGFSDARPKKTILPIISQGKYSYKKVNVDAAKKDKDSIYAHVQRLIALHTQLHLISNTTPTILSLSNPHLLGFAYKQKGTTIVALFNLSSREQTTPRETCLFQGKNMKEILSNRAYKKNKTPAFIELDAYGYRWFTNTK
jgi:maltose alpha-D-glucosyltransferase/alpha-amylase